MNSNFFLVLFLLGLLNIVNAQGKSQAKITRRASVHAVAHAIVSRWYVLIYEAIRNRRPIYVRSDQLHAV